MATTYDISFKLQAGLAASFGGTFEKAQKKLMETQKEIQALGKVQGNISAYQKQQAAIERCRQSQEKYKTQIENVKKELQALIGKEGEHAAGTSQLSNKIIDLKEKYEKVRLEEERRCETLKKLDDSLKGSGINTENLSGESQRLGEELKDLRSEQDKAAEAAEKYRNKSVSAFTAAGEALAASGILRTLKEGYDLMAGITTGAASYADEIGTVSVQYSIAAEDLQAFYYAAELVDVSAETLTSTMSRNIRAMNSARDGTESYVEAYEKLGIKVTDADGQLRDSETVYWEVIDALGEMENETERDAVAIELLGRSAQQVNTLVAAGSGVIKGYAAEAKRAGYVMNNETLQACMALDDEIQRQNSNLMALKNTIGAQLAPEYTKLKQLENEALVALTAFADEHPELVKGITAGTVAFGGLTAAIVACTTAAKLLGSVSGIGTILAVAGGAGALVGVLAAMTSATEDQNDAYAELTATSRKQAKEIDALKAEYAELVNAGKKNTHEAWQLEKQIKSLSEEYESSKQTAQAHREELESIITTLQNSREEYENTINSIDSEYESSIALVTKLGELSGGSQMVAQNQALIVPIIDELNERYEGLGLAIDFTTGKINMGSDQLKQIAKEQAAVLKQQADMKAYADALSNSAKAENAYKEACKELKALEEEYWKAYRAFNAEPSGNAIEKFFLSFTKDYGAEAQMNAAKQSLIEQGKIVVDLREKYEELADSVEYYEKVLGFTTDAIESETDALGDYQSAVAYAVNAVQSDLEALAEKYKEAYNAAYESITGQYDLWDNAAEVVPKSIADINNALATQAAYWSDYNKDMASLTERGENIDGLAEVIASFADGSADSVNAIAGMVDASDEDLKAMVENFKEMQEQEEAAAKAIRENALTELDEIELQMITSIENLDLSMEAEKAARNTMEAYLKGLEEGCEDITKLLSDLPVLSAMRNNPFIAPYERNRSELYPIEAYASGTENAAHGLALVGEYGPELVYFGGGEVVYNAMKTERMLKKFQAWQDAPSLLERVQASPLVINNTLSGPSGGKYEIAIAPVFHITEGENSSEKMEEYSNIVADKVLDRLNEIGIDGKRGAFT